MQYVLIVRIPTYRRPIAAVYGPFGSIKQADDLSEDIQTGKYIVEGMPGYIGEEINCDILPMHSVSTK